jgi:hypothetical protein
MITERAKSPMVMIIFLAAVLVSRASAGQHSMSVSVSATSALQNTDSPALGLRSAYLFLTCSTGASALDAVVDTDLTLLGFSPVSGVLNLGTSSHLLLAIPACPTGTPVLLGSWLVDDQGGTLVLGTSSSPPIVVDCFAAPSDTVLVVGLSTGGSPPPIVGSSGCEVSSTSVTGASWGRIKTLYARGPR